MPTSVYTLAIFILTLQTTVPTTQLPCFAVEVLGHNTLTTETLIISYIATDI